MEELDRDTLVTFVKRIEVGPKELPGGTIKATHRNQPFQQSIRIFYRFIGEIDDVSVRDLRRGQRPDLLGLKAARPYSRIF